MFWGGRHFRGSVNIAGIPRQAQRLIFGHSDRGDLKPYLSGYFDTAVGPKVDPASYAQILETIGVDVDGGGKGGASSVLFATDLLGEAQAARSAGLDVVLMLRPGNAPLPSSATDGSSADSFPTARSFDELFAHGGGAKGGATATKGQ